MSGVGLLSAVTPPATPKTTTSVDPLYTQALAQAKASLAAQTAPITAEQNASDQQFQQREADSTGVATALSKLLGAVGPAVNREYQTGAQNVELAANGFSHGMQDALQGNTDNLNAMLQKLGSPAHLDSHAGEAQDVVYARGGYNPGTTFSKQGAAFGAAADLQSGAALLKGQEDVKDLKAKAIVADQGFQAKIAEMAGKLPGDAQTNYQHLQTFALDNEKFREQVSKDNIDEAYKTAQQKLDVAKYNTSIDEFNNRQDLARQKYQTGVDEFNARQATSHLQSKNVNGHVLTFDPATGKYYVPGTNEVADPSAYKKAAKVSSAALDKARGYLSSAKRGYYSSTSDSSTPLTASQLRGIAKDSKMTLGALLAIVDQKELEKLGLGYVNVGQHDDPKIQQLYVTLVKKYGVPAQRAFKMVGSQYSQWGQAHRDAYFPKASAAQGAAPARDLSAALSPEGAGGVYRAPWNQTLSRPAQQKVAVQALATALGPQAVTQGNVDALVGRINQESGGQTGVVNKWDSNWQAGTPSIGLLQTIPSTFQAHALPGHTNIWDPLDNAIAAVRYMIATYGHIVGPSGSGY